MSKQKVAISLEKHILNRLDCLVKESVFPSRSHAIQHILIENETKNIAKTWEMGLAINT